MEAGVARSACATSADRERNPSVPCPSALGKAFHDDAATIAAELRKVGRIHRPREVGRSEWKIPQRIPGYERLRILSFFIIDPRSRRKRKASSCELTSFPGRSSRITNLRITLPNGVS